VQSVPITIKVVSFNPEWWQGVHDITLSDKISSNNKTEILLKMALNTITLTPSWETPKENNPICENLFKDFILLVIFIVSLFS
jgi:hypothetical protein